MGIKTIKWNGCVDASGEYDMPQRREVQIRSFRKISGILIKTQNKTGQRSNQIVLGVILRVNGCETLIDCDFKALRLANVFQEALKNQGFVSARGKNQHGISVIDFGGFELDPGRVASIVLELEFIKPGRATVGLIEV